MRSFPATLALIALLLLPGAARAFFEETEVGARGVGMGRAYAAIADDASAIYWNPAGLAGLTGPEVAFSHHRPFLIPDLALNFAAAAYPLDVVTLGFAWSRLGLADVTSEDLIYFSAARAQDIGNGRTLSFGATVKFARIGFSEDAATGSGVGLPLEGQTEVTGDLGVHLRLSPKLTFGWTVRNVAEPEFDFVEGGGGTSMERVHQGGVAYDWHPESRMALALVEDGDGNLTPVVGAEIRFYEVFDLRAGVGDLKFYSGVGVRTDRLRVDTSFVTHNTLGISTMVSVVVPIGGTP